MLLLLGVCTNFESTAYAPNKYILGGKQNLSTNEQEQQLTTIIQIRVCLQSVPGRDDIRYGSLCLLVLGETEPDPSCVVCWWITINALVGLLPGLPHKSTLQLIHRPTGLGHPPPTVSDRFSGKQTDRNNVYGTGIILYPNSKRKWTYLGNVNYFIRLRSKGIIVFERELKWARGNLP